MKSTATTKPEDLFKVGDYFTGVDRVIFPRSLYEYLGKQDDGKYLIRHIILSGNVGAMEITSTLFAMTDGDYRHATKEEVLKYLDTKWCEPKEQYYSVVK